MGDQAILKTHRNISVMVALLVANIATAQTPFFAPNLRTDNVKSSTPAAPVTFEDSTVFYRHFEIVGADDPWVPQYNKVRMFYDTVDHHLKALFHWGGTPRILDSIGLGVIAPSDTALFAYLADSAAKVEWVNVLNAPAIGDSVRAAWKADSAGDVHWNNITAKPVLLVPADSTLIRANSDYLYQAKGTYLVPGDSTLQRAYSAYLYQPKGTYLTPADSTEMRDASDALYQPVGSYQPAGTYLVPADSTEHRSNSNFIYQPKDADLTTFAATNPSANVFSFLAAADYAAMRALLSLVPGTNIQAYDADLTTYAGISPSANVQAILGAADYAAIRTLLGLVIGTDVQAYDADLATIAGLAATTDNFIVAVSSAWASRTPAQVKTTLALNNVTNESKATMFTDPTFTTKATAPYFVSSVATGTAPYQATSTTLNTNLNADLLDGYNTSVSPSNSTVVVRHSSGYVYANYFNATSGFTASAPTAVWVETSSDGFLRKQTLANVISNAGLKDTIVKAFGFYNVAVADSAYLLMVPVGAATWTVRDARAIRVGGTAATINVRNKTDNVALFDNYAVTTSMAQVDASINNPSLSAADVLMVELISVTGTVQEVFVELIIEVPK